MSSPILDLFSSVFRNKRVLVTGHTGFKGSWLALWLSELGASVKGLALPPKTSEDNFTFCSLDQRIEHVEGDIRDADMVQREIEAFLPEFVLHLAAQTLVIPSYQDPVYTFKTNIQGTINVLESVRRCKSVKVCTIITSDKCYENVERRRGYTESDSLGGSDPYSASKGAAEIVTHSYRRSFFRAPGTAAVATARAGNVIGGGDFSPFRIVPDCIRSLRANQPVVVRNPDSVRPWQYVLEPLRGYLLLAAALHSSKEKFEGAWNFGPNSRNCVTVENVVNAIIEYWGKGSYRAETSTTKFAESKMLHLNISKSKKELHWRPALSLRRSLLWTVQDYQTPKTTAIDQRIDRIAQYCNLVRNG